MGALGTSPPEANQAPAKGSGAGGAGRAWARLLGSPGCGEEGGWGAQGTGMRSGRRNAKLGPRQEKADSSGSSSVKWGDRHTPWRGWS